MDAVQTTSYRFYLDNPMGERSKDALRVNFDQKLKFEYHGVKFAGDALLRPIFWILAELAVKFVKK